MVFHTAAVLFFMNIYYAKVGNCLAADVCGRTVCSTMYSDVRDTLFVQQSGLELSKVINLSFKF